MPTAVISQMGKTKTVIGTVTERVIVISVFQLAKPTVYGSKARRGYVTCDMTSHRRGEDSLALIRCRPARDDTSGASAPIVYPANNTLSSMSANQSGVHAQRQGGRKEKCGTRNKHIDNRLTKPYS